MKTKRDKASRHITALMTGNGTNPSNSSLEWNLGKCKERDESTSACKTITQSSIAQSWGGKMNIYYVRTEHSSEVIIHDKTTLT